MLKVTVAEVQRDVIKQLGIDLSGSAQLRLGGRQSATRSNPFSATGQALSDSALAGIAQAASPRRCARWSAPA